MMGAKWKLISLKILIFSNGVRMFRFCQQKRIPTTGFQGNNKKNVLIQMKMDWMKYELVLPFWRCRKSDRCSLSMAVRQAACQSLSLKAFLLQSTQSRPIYCTFPNHKRSSFPFQLVLIVIFNNRAIFFFISSATLNKKNLLFCNSK